MTEKSIRFWCGGHKFELRVRDKAGEITSDLHYEDPGEIETTFRSGFDLSMYDTAVDIIESLVLAHACAGIDVASEEYREGLAVTIDKLSNLDWEYE